MNFRIRFAAAALLAAAVFAGAAALAREPASAGGDIALAALPREARDTLAKIKTGGPFPYPDRDGTAFSNRERRLPAKARGYYREYTVPTPGARDRGARRIVAGGEVRSSGDYWYTDDHYNSFRRIKE